MAVRLLQFPYAHYSEKARWALDYKGIQHCRENMLPGPHRRHLKKLTGLSTTPVMLYNDEVVPGSHNIILRLERKFPDTRRLLPQDEALRSEALALACNLDEILGPAVQSVEYAAMCEQGEYLEELFLDEKSSWARLAYRTLFPAAARNLFANGRWPVSDEQHSTSDDTTAAAHGLVTKVMERLVRRIDSRGYLVGHAFSIADLTAAALLAPLVNPPHPDMQKPEPLPAKMQDLQNEFRAYLTTQWVLEMYSRFRPHPERHNLLSQHRPESESTLV